MSELVAVVLDYRTPDKTLACLRTLAHEGVRRIVLVENSEDGGASLRAMQPGLEELRTRGLAIDVLDEGRNLGFAAGVNRALSHVRRLGVADVLLINSDARMKPGALEAMTAALGSGADMVVPMLVSTEGEKRKPVAYYQKRSAIMARRRLPGSLAYATGACMLLSRTVAEPGLLDEDFFFYGEDVMLSARLLAHGRRWLVEESAEVIHEGSGSARNGSLFYEYHINRAHLLLAGKLSPGRTGRPLEVVAILLSRAIVRSFRFRSRIPIKGLRMALDKRSDGRPARFTPDGED